MESLRDNFELLRDEYRYATKLLLKRVLTLYSMDFYDLKTSNNVSSFWNHLCRCLKVFLVPSMAHTTFSNVREEILKKYECPSIIVLRY